MSTKRHGRKGLSLFLALALVFSMFIGLIPTNLVQTALAASASDYPTPANYSARAHVDESVGLRAAASITGDTSGNRAVGIDALNTLTIRPNAEANVTADSTLSVSVDPYDNYTLSQVVVAALAQIEHDNGTKEAVKDIQTFSTGTFTYTVPNFSSYVGTNDIIEVEVIVYADFTYTSAPVDYEINLATGTVTALTAGHDASDIGKSGNTFLINTATGNVAGSTIKITGKTGGSDSGNASTAMYQIYVDNSSATHTLANRRINLIFEDASFLTHAAANRNPSSPNYYKVYNENTRGATEYSSTKNTAYGNTDRKATSGTSTNTNPNSNSPLVLTNVDAYVTLRGENVMAQSSTAMAYRYNQNAITVDGSASLIITEESAGGSLYARGGGCASAIGATGEVPCGYIEIDGGTVTAESAFNSHHYAGIGNGGHFNSTDPGIRGIVINGGTVNALGFHYGIGGNGGTTGGIMNTLGPQYVIVTGGTVVSEASAGSAGAALGFAYNNDQNIVHIGRPDKDDSGSTVTSVNWGYGAAISGNMTFYSGTTNAYSGEYAAAIGGNAISNASTATAKELDAQTASSAVNGTPLTVYGGNVTAVAGAFEQEYYGGDGVPAPDEIQDYSTIEYVRGNSGSRSSAAAAYDGSQSVPTASYGAGIGGAISKTGGTENHIFAGTFKVTSSVSGAGIGGGGGYGTTLSAGDGGITWIGSLTNLSDGSIAFMDFTINSGTYGAGIGGGGSASTNAGSGGNVYIAGDAANSDFDIFSGTYGAGFGGGGSASANAGNGGDVVINGGRFGIYSGTYGAGFGGGGSYSGSGGSGGNVTINDGDFTVDSGLYGAGIGGGGSYSGDGGNGGGASSSFTVNGGEFTVVTGATSYSVDPVSGDVTVTISNGTPNNNYSYGAGIGGGGSYSGDGGNGLTNFLATGGYFRSSSHGYGAGIGGGGSYSSKGGTGGISTYEGGTVVVSYPGFVGNFHDTFLGSIGMGGGFSSIPGGDKTGDGTVTITGGNIATQIVSKVDPMNPSWTAWTMPYPGSSASLPAGASATGTQKAVLVDTTNSDIVASEIDKEVYKIGYRFNDPLGSAGLGNTTIYEYGVNDMFVTDDGHGKPELWIWIPSAFRLTYDLNGGYELASTDFDIADAARTATGTASVLMDKASNGSRVYSVRGETKELLTWQDKIGTNETYDGATWGEVNPGASYHGSDPALYTLLDHAAVSGTAVAFVGWTTETKLSSLHDSSTGSDHIFGVGDGWDYHNFAVETVEYSDKDITVYALWGYDVDGNGIADVLESASTLSYDGNGFDSGTVPTNTMPYSIGDDANISPAGTMKKTGKVFIGWTEAAQSDVDKDWDLTTLTSTYTMYISGPASGTTGTLNFSNGTSITGSNKYHFATGGDVVLYALWADDVNANGIPDFLEAKYKLIHETTPATLTLGSPIPDGTYVAGEYGVSEDGGVGGLNLTANNSDGYTFIGWTADAAAVKLLTSSHSTANVPGDIADQLTLSTAFTSSDMKVYAVWAEDANNNGVLDYLESGLSLIFNKNTTEAVNGVPVDTNSYRKNDFVDASSDDLLTKADSNMDPYMERTGWVLLGWVAADPGSTDHTTDPGAAYTYLNKISNRVSAMQFTTHTDDITVYAVWGIDSNNNGVPDWDDADGRKVQYVPSLSSGYDPASMPFNNGSGTYVDRGPSVGSNFTNYTSDETVNVSTQIPTAAGYVFMGWSPMFNHGTVFGTSAWGIERFYEHLALLEDILEGVDNGVGNWISYTPPGGSMTSGTYASDIEYTLGTGLRDSYEDFVTYIGAGYTTTQALQAAYGGYNWSSYSGEGFLDTVTFDAFNQEMYATSGDSYCETWQLYAIWGVDANNNGIADMFEDSHTLYYKIDVDNPVYPAASGGPAPSNHFAGSTAALDPCTPHTPTLIGKQDNNGQSMILLGWTADNTVKECYGAGEAGILPSFASSVTFGDFDITVYAVWALDENQNDTPDVYENIQYTLTYDANGGDASSVPVDSNTYSYGDTAAVDTATTPTHSSGYIFLYWTDDAAAAPSYGFGDRASLPGKVTSVTFDTATANVTLYAVWGEDTNNNGDPDVYEDDYGLTYDANGGDDSSVPIDNNGYAWGQNVTLSTTAPTHPSGYVFVGWTEAEPHTFSSVYYAGQQAMLPAIVTDVTFATIDITVYAVWSTDFNNNGTPDVYEDGYTVTYDANGGTNAPAASNPYPTGSSVVVSGQGGMTYSGHSFVKWNEAADGSGTDYSAGSLLTIGTSSITLYAQWEEGYTVAYDANGGTGSHSDTVPSGGTHTVLSATAAGISRSSYTFTGWNTAPDGTGISYAAGATLTVTSHVTLYAQWNYTGGGGGGGPTSPSTYKVNYHANGGTGSKSVTVDKGKTHTVLSASAAGISYSGYTFTGWNTTSSGSGTSYSANDTITVNANVTLYAQWKKNDGTTNPSLETDNHIIYVNGYPDGSVQPEGYITRAEAANIFFRLLDADVHSDRNDPIKNQFSDIKGSEWHAQGINYLASLGIIGGYADGTFRPDTPITRAEFAAIAARFDDLSYTDENVFTDVSSTHWAVAYINSASLKGWITGYSDKTFQPEQYITRGETVTLVNRMLNRAIDDKALEAIENPYNDITKSHWAYAAIIEASYKHEYERDTNGDERWILS